MSKNTSWGMAVLLLAASCSGGSSYSESTHDIARAYCEFIFECADERTPRIYAEALFLGSVERCMDLVVRESAGELEATEQAIRDGAILFDADAARACVGALRGVDTCRAELLEITFETTQACESILVGQIAPGQACAFDEQCTRGHECSVPPGTCGGVCVVDPDAPPTYRTVPAGGVCSRNDECVDAHFCYAGLCRSLAVSETAIAGLACTTLVQTSATVTLVTCLPTLGCIEDPDTGDDVCAEPLALGTECSPGDSCAPGSVCLEDVGETGTYTCKELIVLRNVGDTCTVDPFEGGPQRFCDHGRGLYCSAAGTCAALGDGSLDSACRSPVGLEDENRITCKRGLYCDDDTLTCRPLRGADAACTDDEQCASAQCNPTGTCESSYVECRAP